MLVNKTWRIVAIRQIRQSFLPAKVLFYTVCNNYACLQALVNNALAWQSSCVIANNAQQTAKAICPRL